MWCSGDPSSAIQIAQSKYGLEGSIQDGYYFLADPRIWRWDISVRAFYATVMAVLVWFGAIVLILTGCYIAGLICRRHDRSYVQLEQPDL